MTATVNVGSVTRLHVVRVGDTLESLSLKYFGDHDHVEALATLNSLSPTAILPIGSRVRLPDSTVIAPTTTQPDGTADGGYVLAPVVVTAPKPLWMRWELWAGVAAVSVVAYLLLRRRK